MYIVLRKSPKNKLQWASISLAEYKKLKWKSLEKSHLKRFPPGKSTLQKLKDLEKNVKYKQVSVKV